MATIWPLVVLLLPCGSEKLSHVTHSPHEHEHTVPTITTDGTPPSTFWGIIIDKPCIIISILLRNGYFHDKAFVLLSTSNSNVPMKMKIAS